VPRKGEVLTRLSAYWYGRTAEIVPNAYLIQIGFVQRTPRGRMAARRAYEHLGLEYREQDPGLFG